MLSLPTLASFWSRVSKTSSCASEMPAMSKSFSLIILPASRSSTKSAAASLAASPSKGYTVTSDRNSSASCLFSFDLCLSNSYSVMLVVLISSALESSSIKETSLSSPAMKSMITLVSINVAIPHQTICRNWLLFRRQSVI